MARRTREYPIVSASNVFTPHFFTPSLPARYALGTRTFLARAFAGIAFRGIPSSSCRKIKLSLSSV
jgi:hypothetical protein